MREGPQLRLSRQQHSMREVLDEVAALQAHPRGDRVDRSGDGQRGLRLVSPRRSARRRSIT